MAKRYQHHKLPSCLGYPKHEGKDEENLTHFFGHYRYILFSMSNLNIKKRGISEFLSFVEDTCCILYFTSSNISYTDYQQIIFAWYKNVSSIRVVLIEKHLGCYHSTLYFIVYFYMTNFIDCFE